VPACWLRGGSTGETIACINPVPEKPGRARCRRVAGRSGGAQNLSSWVAIKDPELQRTIARKRADQAARLGITAAIDGGNLSNILDHAAMHIRSIISDATGHFILARQDPR